MSTHSVSREEQLSLFPREGSYEPSFILGHFDDYHAMHTTIALDPGLDDKIIRSVTLYISLIYNILVVREVQASSGHR